MKLAVRLMFGILIIFISLFIFIGADDKDMVKSNLLTEKTFINLKKASPKALEKENTVLSKPSSKTIYLTFDDGPSYLTNQILDILKQNNVAATFFVIGSHIDEYQDTVKRAYLDGHAVALHSDSHVYSYIYTSLDNYLADLNSIRTKVYNITQNYSRIVRLPGGASNTVSKKYKAGVITEITNWLNKHDYYYFDWNVDSLDASGRVSKEVIYNSVVNSLKEGDNIVLMHDAATKATTVEALPLIIEYAKANGYTFAKITKNTIPYHHKILN